MSFFDRRSRSSAIHDIEHVRIDETQHRPFLAVASVVATVFIGLVAGALQYATVQWGFVFYFVEAFLGLDLNFALLETFVFPLTMLSALYTALIASAPRIRLFLCASWAGAILTSIAFTWVWLEIITGLAMMRELDGR